MAYLRAYLPKKINNFSFSGSRDNNAGSMYHFAYIMITEKNFTTTIFELFSSKIKRTGKNAPDMFYDISKKR